MNDILRGTGIHKEFPSGEGVLHVLKGIDLEVHRGEFLCIVGASGVGKSTLLHVVGLLDRPTRGSIRFDGEEVSGLNTAEAASIRNEKVGFVFQFHGLLPEFTAQENVMLPMLIGRRNFLDARRSAIEMLDRVGLQHRLSHRPSQLSGGELQRVSIGRALVKTPRIILADEPTGNLDQQTSKEIHDLMFELCRSIETSFIIVTHNQELSDRADRILYMVDGRIAREECKR
jgi:lipoprotein-releasing system ATP-binding protein